MQAVAVSAFHDQVIHIGNERGIAEDGRALASEIAGEGQASFAPRFRVFDVEDGDGRSQNVTGIKVFGDNARHDLERRVVRDRGEMLERFFGILRVVERFNGRLATFGILLVHVLGVVFLNATRVEDHVLREIMRRRRGFDEAVEPFFYQVRDVARVIGVGVRQQQYVHRARIVEEVLVAEVGLLAGALKQAAIEQEL